MCLALKNEISQMALEVTKILSYYKKRGDGLTRFI